MKMQVCYKDMSLLDLVRDPPVLKRGCHENPDTISKATYSVYYVNHYFGIYRSDNSTNSNSRHGCHG